MPLITALAGIALALLVLTAALGLVALLRWRRHRAAGYPAGRIAAHIALQVVSIGVWIAFLATGLPSVAWSAFVVITAGQVVGDLLMFASYRARHPDAGGVGYAAAAADVLSFRRKAPALHATVGAIAWFGMLGICITASFR